MTTRLSNSRQVSMAARQAARAACRRSQAAAATILAPSFNGRATGCAATIVATRKFRTYLPASTSKFWVQPFPKRLADSKGSAFGRFPQKAKSPY